MNQEVKSKQHLSPGVAFIALLLINICWGGSYAATKFALDVVPPSTLAFIRFIIGGFFLIIIPTKNHHRLKTQDWKDLFLIGSFGLAISNALLNLGLQMTSSTKTAIAASLEPVFTILLAGLILKEILQRRTIAATSVSIIGAFVLMLGDKTADQIISELSRSGELLGDILVIVSIFLAAVYSILMKPVASRIGALRATSYSFLIGAILLLPIVFLEISQLWPLEFNKNAVYAILFLGIVCNAIAFLLWNIILKHTSAGIMAVTLYAQPVGGVVIGWLWLNETLSTMGFVGAALILGGMWLLPGETEGRN